jgi:hypothetical protein
LPGRITRKERKQVNPTKTSPAKKENWILTVLHPGPRIQVKSLKIQEFDLSFSNNSKAMAPFPNPLRI